MSPAPGEEAIVNRSSLSLSLFSSILHLCQLSSKYSFFSSLSFGAYSFINISVGFSLYPCGRVATLKQLLRIVHAVANESLYSFDIFPGHFWPCIAEMTLVSDLAAASAHVHDSAKLSSGDYDRRLRELVEYLRRLLSTKALDTLANDESILDVSGSCFIARMNECLIELLLTFVFLPVQRFDPAKDSIPYLFILRLQIQTAQATTGEAIPTKIQPSSLLWTRSADFLRNFDRVQVRYVGREWRELVEIVGLTSQAISKASLFFSCPWVYLLTVHSHS